MVEAILMSKWFAGAVAFAVVALGCYVFLWSKPPRR